MGKPEPRLLIWCCACQNAIERRLTNGAEVYPHREDLIELPFWKCDDCGNHVGCHHKTDTPTKPLGFIPTPEIREMRKHIHALLDPIWKSGKISRKKLYARIGIKSGMKTYHTANIRSVHEGRQIYRIIKRLKKEVFGET